MEEPVKLISYVKLRQAIGWLGIFLPILMLSESLFFCQTPVKDTISHYYYANVGDVFVAVLTALAVFFFSYKGYEREKDNYLTNIAGIAALGIAFFPTNGFDQLCPEYCEMKVPSIVFHYLHMISAFTFFTSLALLLIFFFTRSNDLEHMTRQKKIRNGIYRSCGIIMLLCLAAIIACVCMKYYNLFWLETLALFAFGFAWLIKGELILKDKSNT